MHLRITFHEARRASTSSGLHVLASKYAQADGTYPPGRMFPSSRGSRPRLPCRRPERPSRELASLSRQSPTFKAAAPRQNGARVAARAGGFPAFGMESVSVCSIGNGRTSSDSRSACFKSANAVACGRRQQTRFPRIFNSAPGVADARTSASELPRRATRLRCSPGRRGERRWTQF